MPEGRPGLAATAAFLAPARATGHPGVPAGVLADVLAGARAGAIRPAEGREGGR